MSALKVGSSGAEVTQLQNDLRALGFEIAVDGTFGAKTKEAVEELQTAFGYDVDGIVGKGTTALVTAQKGHGWNVTNPASVKNALEAQGKKTEKGSLAGIPLKGNLKKGSKGADVRYLQRRLSALGFAAAPTGEFDDATDAAVKALQTQFGYTVDGIVGSGTHELLNAQIGHDFRKQN